MSDADLDIVARRLASMLGLGTSHAIVGAKLRTLEAEGYIVIQPQTPTLELIPAIVPSTDAAEVYAKAVVDTINTLTGRHFRVTAETVTRAKALMRARIKVETMVEVVKFKAAAWSSKPDMAQYIQPSTLMRLSKAKEYLAQMEAGPVKVGRGEAHQPTQTTVTAEELRAFRNR